MDAEARIAGVLLGTALGDALGLPCEGMSARRIARRFGRLDRFRLLGRTGYVSDDTEQSALLAQSLARNPQDPARAFRYSLLGWFGRLPWGVGLATVRACFKILLGLRRSGVRSAGNGAAMLLRSWLAFSVVIALLQAVLGLLSVLQHDALLSDLLRQRISVLAQTTATSFKPIIDLGLPISMIEEFKKRVDELWGQLGI